MGLPIGRLAGIGGIPLVIGGGEAETPIKPP